MISGLAFFIDEAPLRTGLQPRSRGQSPSVVQRFRVLQIKQHSLLAANSMYK
jgi:hypothetical protein